MTSTEAAMADAERALAGGAAGRRWRDEAGAGAAWEQQAAAAPATHLFKRGGQVWMRALGSA